MSLHISGLKFKSTNIQEIYSFLNSTFRDEILDIQEREVNKYLVLCTTMYLDDCFFGIQELEKFPLGYVAEGLQKSLENQRTHGFNSDKSYYKAINYDFLCVLFLYESHIYMTHQHRYDFDPIIQKYTDVIFTDFSYQNQMDEPEDVTEEEWTKRSEVWNNVLPPAFMGVADIGNKTGFTKNYIYDYTFSYIRTSGEAIYLEDFIPTKEQRAKRLARNRTIDRLLGDKKKDWNATSKLVKTEKYKEEEYHEFCDLMLRLPNIGYNDLIGK